MADTETGPCRISLSTQRGTLVQHHAIVLHTAVHLVQFDILWRERLATMHQHDVIGRYCCILGVSPHVDVTGIALPVVPFLR